MFSASLIGTTPMVDNFIPTPPLNQTPNSRDAPADVFPLAGKKPKGIRTIKSKVKLI